MYQTQHKSDPTPWLVIYIATYVYYYVKRCEISALQGDVKQTAVDSNLSSVGIQRTRSTNWNTKTQHIVFPHDIYHIRSTQKFRYLCLSQTTMIAIIIVTFLF